LRCCNCFGRASAAPGPLHTSSSTN
jgi:hypothetical protein